jgi:hypothetical protein
MQWNNHFRLAGKHSFLSASKYHWLNYDEDQLKKSYLKYKFAERGTILHDIAKKLIEQKVKLPNSNMTLAKYVNDAIDFGMTPELVLYYSENCFGTADTILYDEEKHILRIHDLKTGEGKTHMEQLYIYAALFCLEYRIDPYDIQIALRIYQNNKILRDNPKSEDIVNVMQKIIDSDDKIKLFKESE